MRSWRARCCMSVPDIISSLLFFEFVYIERVVLLQLKGEIAECNEAREREMPLVQEEAAKVNELKQSIEALNKHQSSLRSTLKKLKDRTAEMDQKVSHYLPSNALWPIMEA